MEEEDVPKISIQIPDGDDLKEDDYGDEVDEVWDPRSDTSEITSPTNFLSVEQRNLMIRRISSGEFSTISFRNGIVPFFQNDENELALSELIPKKNPSSTPDSPSVDFDSDSVETVTMNGKLVISQGTVEGLIYVLLGVQDLAMNPKHLNGFLCTYRFFLTPPELLEFLIKQYTALENIRQRDKSQEEYRAYGQRKILNFCRKWLENFTPDFSRNPEMEEILKDFLKSETCQVERHSKFIESFLTAIDEILGGDPSSKKSTRTGSCTSPTAELLTRISSLKVEEEKRRSFLRLSFGDISPSSFAEQLTGMEFEMFKKIEQLEFVEYLLIPREYPVPNLLEFISWSERMINWVAKEVCLKKDLKERCECIENFLLGAKKCEELLNLNAVFEIIGGLLLPSVQRLSKTWKTVLSHSKFKSIWNELLELVSPGSSYKKYCHIVESAISEGKIVLPWLKIYLSDMELISRSPTYVTENRINYYKFTLISQILSTISHCQSIIDPTSIQADDSIRKWLTFSTTTIPSQGKGDELISLSHECEPPSQNEVAESKKVFGVELGVISGRLGAPTKWTVGTIPKFLKDIFEHLEKDENLKILGVFRTSGNQGKINEMKQQLEDSGGENLDFTDATVHDVAGLLKLFLRELPDPLFTSKLFESFIALTKISVREQQLELLQTLLSMIPDSNRNLVTYLLKFLYCLSTYSEFNKMDAKNISVCLAPTVFGFGEKGGSSRSSTPIFGKSAEAQISRSLQKQNRISLVLQLMIESQAGDNWVAKEDEVLLVN